MTTRWTSRLPAPPLDRSTGRSTSPSCPASGRPATALRSGAWSEPAGPSAVAGADVIVTGASAGYRRGRLRGPRCAVARACTWSRAIATGSRPRRRACAARLGASGAGLETWAVRPRRTSTRSARSRPRFAPAGPTCAGCSTTPACSSASGAALAAGPRAHPRDARARAAAADRAARARAARGGAGPRRLRLVGRHVHGAAAAERPRARARGLRRPALLRARQAPPGDRRRGARGALERRCDPGLLDAPGMGAHRRADARRSRASPAWSGRCCAIPSRAPTPPSGCWPRRTCRAARAASGTTAAPGRRTGCRGRARAPPSATVRSPSWSAAAASTTPLPARSGDGAQRRMSRVAIVGAGVAGLVAARELDRAGHEITVFDAGSHAGGHAHTVAVDVPGANLDVDIGFIVFNDRNYPNFERLLDELGVATKPAEMSLSVSDGEGKFEWCSRPGGVFARPLPSRRPALSPDDVGPGALLSRGARARRRQRLGAFARRVPRRGGYSRWFVDRLLVPQVSAVWSADPGQLHDFPASFLAEFLVQPRRASVPRPAAVAHGLRRLADLRRAPGRAVRRPAAAARPGAGGAPRRRRRGGRDRRAAPSATTRWCWPCTPTRRWRCSPTRRATEREVLGAIPYVRNDAVLHTDAEPAAAPPPRLGVVELPPGRRGRRADDDHLPHEPPPVAARRPRAAASRSTSPSASTRRR